MKNYNKQKATTQGIILKKKNHEDNYKKRKCNKLNEFVIGKQI